MSSIEWRVYAQWREGDSLTSLKSKTIAFYQIPAQYFNAVKVGVEGKIHSVMTNLGNTRDSYQRPIKATAHTETDKGTEQRRKSWKMMMSTTCRDFIRKSFDYPVIQCQRHRFAQWRFRIDQRDQAACQVLALLGIRGTNYFGMHHHRKRLYGLIRNGWSS